MKSASVWHPPNLLPRLLPRDGDLSTFYRPIAAGCRNEKSAPIARFLLGFCLVAPTGFEPVFESRSRFRQVSYAVTDQQHPATSTRLKHAAESSLKHPEHDHVKREPGGRSPDERKLQNNFRTGAVAAAASRTQFCLRRVHEVRVAMGTIQRIFRDWSGQDIYLLTTIYSRRPTHDVV